MTRHERLVSRTTPRYKATDAYRIRMKLTIALHYLTRIPLKPGRLIGAMLWMPACLLSTHTVAASTEILLLAQARDAVPAASVFSPWGNDDVRQGARPKTDNPAPPQVQNKPQEAPKDVRRSSTPSSQAIPLFVRPPQTETVLSNTMQTPASASSGEPAAIVTE